MTVGITMILLVAWVHWFSDFVLQSDAMAKNKSSSVKWLSVHVATYSVPFLLIFGWKYAIINGILHWIVDFFTSKATAYLWKKEERHWFFVVIGFDQALHLTCLLMTLPLMHFLNGV